jgi:hypothetical protein
MAAMTWRAASMALVPGRWKMPMPTAALPSR